MALALGTVSVNILARQIFCTSHNAPSMANTSDIKNGMVLNHNKVVANRRVSSRQTWKRCSCPTKLKNIETGKVVDNTFNAGHKIPVRIETREHTFLYNDDEGYHFMNAETYEQIRLDKHLINVSQFLKDGLSCLVVFHAEEERPINCPAEPCGVGNHLHRTRRERRHRDQLAEARRGGHRSGSARATFH